jgi:hypothetical protein
MGLNRNTALSGSCGRAVLRFCVRLALLASFAAIAHVGFRAAFPAFLVTGRIFCALWAAIHREKLFAPILTHWDEAALFVMLGKLAFRFL